MSRPITIFACLLLTAILTITLILPKKEILDSVQKKVAEKMAEIQGKEEYLLNLSRLSAELKNYPSSLSKIDLALPAEPNLPGLFDFLQKVTSQSGLILVSLRPSAAFPAVVLEERAPEFQETRFNLEVSGSYPAFKDFLSLLEKSARLIEVEAVSFSSGLGEGLIKFELTIKVRSY